MKTVLRIVVRLLFKPLLAPWVPLSLQRRGSSAAGLISKFPDGTQATKVEMNGVPGLRYRTSRTKPGRALLYLHGGAYVLGGPASHGALTAQLGNASGAEAYLIDYRLAPEHPYPAAPDDALAAYRWLLEHYQPGQIAIAGDSAGGNLALVTVQAIRDAGLPPPAALALLSPWLDLSHSGASARERARRDPMLRVSWTSACAKLYAGEVPLDDPRISPLFGELKGLPPMIVHLGSEEIVYSDSERLAQKAKAAGVPLMLRAFEGLWHDFQLHAGQLREADESIADIGRFMQDRMGKV
jgi:monoterpene epsilon-lactone hydrolase